MQSEDFAYSRFKVTFLSMSNDRSLGLMAVSSHFSTTFSASSWQSQNQGEGITAVFVICDQSLILPEILACPLNYSENTLCDLCCRNWRRFIPSLTCKLINSSVCICFCQLRIFCLCTVHFHWQSPSLACSLVLGNAPLSYLLTSNSSIENLKTRFESDSLTLIL